MQAPEQLVSLAENLNAKLIYSASKYYRKYRFKLEIQDTLKTHEFRRKYWSERKSRNRREQRENEKEINHIRDHNSVIFSRLRVSAREQGDKTMRGNCTLSYFTNDLSTVQQIADSLSENKYPNITSIYYSHDLDRAICVRKKDLPYGNYRFRADVHLPNREKFWDLMKFIDNNQDKFKYNDTSRAWVKKWGYMPTKTRFYAVDQNHLAFAMFKYSEIIHRVTEYKLESELSDEAE